MTVLSLQGAGHAVQGTRAGLRLIVVGSPEEAGRVVEQLNRGADFATLAKQRSVDPTAGDGGYLGRLDPARLRPELRAALQGVAPGQISEVVRIPTGYAILKIVPDSEVPSLPNPSPTRVLAVTAQGAVSYSIAVGGFAEAQAIFLRFSKPGGWNQDLRAVCELRKRSLSTALQQLERAVAPANPARASSGTPFDLLQTYYGYAQVLAYQGKVDDALEQWQVAGRIAQESVAAMAPEMNRTLGIGCFHKAEVENGLYRAPDDRCLFPPRADARFLEPGTSERAVKYFLDYLAQRPNDLEVRWLLNLAEMTLGRYPGGVPQPYLIPPSAFESAADIGRFVDVAPQAGLTAFSLAGGAIVDDFENRGLLDVVTSSMDVCESLHYFRNNGDGTFS